MTRTTTVAALLALLALPALTTASATPSTAPGPSGLLLDGLAETGLPGTRTVTLLTGEKATVSSDLSGRVSVTALESGTKGLPDQVTQTGPVSASRLDVTGFETPGKRTILSAVPSSATALVDSGAVDRDLFDLNALATRGFGVSATPVTVHFNGVSTAAESESLAEALPGSSYVSGTASSGRATVSVPVTSSGTFWDAVTKARGLDPSSPEGRAWLNDRAGGPRDLADGIAGLTLDGAPLATVSAPTGTVPAYTLTVRVHASKDPSRWAWGEELGLDFSAASAPLIGVTGPSAGMLLNPSFGCEGTKPACGTVVMSYTVPAGVYYLSAYFGDTRDTIPETTYFQEPEVAVNGNRTIDLHMDDGIWVDPKTPKASELAGYGLSMRRALPDGRTIYNLSTKNGDTGSGYYLAPTKTPAVTGAYNMRVTHEWHEPYITMATDRGLDLGARYPFQATDSDSTPPRPELDVRNGRMGVVDVGVGAPKDFASADVKGKLVVLGPNPDQAVPCSVELTVMERAIAAGAAGVVFDPRTPHYPTGVCNVLFWVPIVEGNTAVTAPDLPLMSLDPDVAGQFRDELRQRKVTVNVDSPGHAAMGYIYDLTRHFGGGVPSVIDQTVTSESLATRQTTLRDTAGRDAVLAVHSWYPEFMMSMNWSYALFPTTSPGRHLTEYLTVSRDAKWSRQWAGALVAESVDEIVTTRNVRTETFFGLPQSVGPPKVPVEANTWSDWAGCSLCRAGDELTPLTSITTPESNHVTQIGLLRAMVLTDGAGQQIPLVRNSHNVPVFQLHPESQRYTLVSTMTGGNRFEWNFSSAHVVGEQKPLGTNCLNEIFDSGPCGSPQPLIYLRYGAPLDDANTGASNARQTVAITPYHQATGASPIRQVATQVSFDGGTTWAPATMKSQRDGSWAATFTVPPLAKTDGYVSLRTTARDEAGNTTDQVRPHAYPLR